MFDLDPAAPMERKRPWPTAKNHFTIEDDGLSKEWFGRVWLNPPYRGKIEEWMGKMADHGNGVALVFAKTETRWFFDTVWEKASAVLFIKGRINFFSVTGRPVSGSTSARTASVLVAYGQENAAALERASGLGKFIALR